MKARYLAFFSYIGTSFRSSEKIWLKEASNYPDPLSVQGLLELGLLRLRSLNYPKVILSSRTDKGVHALNSSAHFDLDKYGSGIYEPRDVIYTLNKFFHKNETSIHVNKCYRVRDNFNARFNAVRRIYLYRLAVLKSQIDIPDYSGIASYIPIEEWKRCHFLRHPNFDAETFKSAAQQFVGYHDFTTFKKNVKLLQYKHSRREIYSIDVRPGRPQITNFTARNDGAFDYWDIEIQGRGFVHNQIRRMVATLISVATGKLPPEEIKVMLQVPSKHSWYQFIQNTPPDGLYLCDVRYNPEDLLYDADEETKERIEDKADGDSDSECS